MSVINNLQRRFLKLCFSIILFSFLTILFYCLIALYPNSLSFILCKMILYHTLIVTLSLFTITALAWPLIIFKWQAVSLQYIYGSLWGVLISLLILLYILSFLGSQIVSSPLAFDIFLVYLKQLDNTIANLNISAWPAYLFIIGTPALIICLLTSQSKMLWCGSEYVLTEMQRFSKKIYSMKSKGKWLLITALSPIILYTGYKFNKLHPIARLQTIREPFTLVFFQDNFQDQLYKSLSYPDTLSIKKKYPTNIKFNKKNVILIIVDDLRADYLSLYNYPENISPWLDSMYKKGSLRKVDYAFSATSMSLGGILCTLRSKTWPLMSMSSFTLPDLLKQQGYKTRFILSGDHTNFYNLKRFFGDKMDTYYDGTNADGLYFNDDRLLFQGLNQIPKYQNTPSFFYLHMMSVHNLGTRQPKFAKYQPAHPTKHNIETYKNNYKNGVIQMDNYIHQLFNEFALKGYLKNSIVIITADHGESIGEKGQFGHWINVANNQLHIPLLIYDTDSSVVYRSDHAVQADIAATIVDRLGLPIPTTWTGESLLHSSHNEYSYHSVKHYYTVMNYQAGKILKYHFDSNTKQESAYEVISDPAELKNILKSLPSQNLETLRAKMNEYIKKCSLEDNS